MTSTTSAATTAFLMRLAPSCGQFTGPFVEMPRHREQSFCCGAGGANYWYDVAKGQPAGVLRVRKSVPAGPRRRGRVSVLRQDA